MTRLLWKSQYNALKNLEQYIKNTEAEASRVLEDQRVAGNHAQQKTEHAIFRRSNIMRFSHGNQQHGELLSNSLTRYQNTNLHSRSTRGNIKAHHFSASSPHNNTVVTGRRKRKIHDTHSMSVPSMKTLQSPHEIYDLTMQHGAIVTNCPQTISTSNKWTTAQSQSNPRKLRGIKGQLRMFEGKQLPPGWIVAHSKSRGNRVYFFHRPTGQSQYSLPKEDDEISLL